ncbi:hypothetical protein [Bathymodiolus japonicus methanotrophic gill symbiont]|uniref:hypothetical protein n=1 Tax=Bathymodiolus japonicus methanotrophic gill symbiont TaxID=113269 RepID=UPI001C8DDE60|nr:hypothetical protein [Bathymodiolus japonicus methanotrophic gill symbiont]
MLKDLPLSEHIHQHCNESMERALLAERHPLWARSCPELKDIDFIRLGLLGCISVVDSGRHFLQTNEQIYGQLLPHSTYFKSLKSHRRTSMLEAFEQQSYHLHAETLLSQGIDYLKLDVQVFPSHCHQTLTFTQQNNTLMMLLALSALNLCQSYVFLMASVETHPLLIHLTLSAYHQDLETLAMT